MDHQHPVASALLACGHRHSLPVGAFLVAALALELEHAALGQQGREAGGTQLGGFFHQPVHALVGRDAGQQMHFARGFTLHGVVRADLDLHIAAAHAQHLGFEFAAREALARLAFEQGDAVARLQAQYLDMARRAGGQLQRQAGAQGKRAVEAGHGAEK